MIYHCERCGKPFERRPCGKKARHCSYACKSATVRKIDQDGLRQAALAGVTIREMSKRFHVQRRTVRKWLEQDGLWMVWWRQRYYA